MAGFKPILQTCRGWMPNSKLRRLDITEAESRFNGPEPDSRGSKAIDMPSDCGSIVKAPAMNGFHHGMALRLSTLNDSGAL